MKNLLITLYVGVLPLASLIITFSVWADVSYEKKAYAKYYEKKYTQLLVQQKQDKQFYENILLNKKLKHIKKTKHNAGN